MGQVLRDRIGNKIGEIKEERGKQIIFDKIGNRLGHYDGKDTYDRLGNRIGSGNLLMTLLR